MQSLLPCVIYLFRVASELVSEPRSGFAWGRRFRSRLFFSLFSLAFGLFLFVFSCLFILSCIWISLDFFFLRFTYFYTSFRFSFFPVVCTYFLSLLAFHTFSLPLPSFVVYFSSFPVLSFTFITPSILCFFFPSFFLHPLSFSFTFFL